MIKKLIGHRYKNRYNWGEFYWTWHPKHWNLSLRLTDRHSEIGDMLIFCPLIFKSYIYLPTRFCQNKESKYGSFGDGKSYGFYVFESIKNFTTLVLCYGKQSKHIEMPWNYEWYSSEILDFNGKVVHYDCKNTRHIPYEIRWKAEDYWKKEVSKQVDYTYKRKNGEIQKRTATIFPTRATYKMRIFPWIKKVYNYVDYSFNDEVGEKTGSWKGGVLASGEIIKDGETPLQAFGRMEKERKFN